MSAADTLATLQDQGVVGIVRSRTAADASATARTLVDAGLRAVEVSLTTPGALGVIEELTATGAEVGAGTVRTPADARDAIAAGAAFLVSPQLDLDVVRLAVASDLAVVPGCLTPTEMQTAQAAGAPAVKIFPAQLWSPAALRGMLEAMPELRCVPTGGVGPEDAASWIAAGALAVGVGGSLTRSDDPAAAVASLLQAVRGARG